MDRDLIGYGANPPNPNWPNPGGSGAARLAVNFVLNFEEGSEPQIGDGDPASEWGLTEYGATSPGVKGRDLAAEGMFAYGSRVGFWRVMRLFAERGLPMTIFGCALALERNPPAAAAIKAAGHDVCCHGWRWEKHFELDEATERSRIARAIASIQSTMGDRPLGWYCRSGPGVNTRRLLVEEGGFLYDSDAYDDELPYWTTCEGKQHLVVPYSLSTNDSKFGRGTFATGDDFALRRRPRTDLAALGRVLAGDRCAVRHLHHLINPAARGIHLQAQLAIGRTGVQTKTAVHAAVEVRLLGTIKGDERVGHGSIDDSDQTYS